MHETSIEHIRSEVVEQANSVLFLCAPNFEARSISIAMEFTEGFAKLPENVYVAVLTLQGQRARVESLEHLKRLNTRCVEQQLKSRSGRHGRQTIPYPDGYSSDITRTAMESFFFTLPEPIVVVLDISSLPSRIVLDMMNVLKEAALVDRVAEIFVAYSFPERYPLPRNPTESGVPHLYQHRHVPMANIVTKDIRASAAVVLGNQGFQAEQFVETLPHDRRVSLYAFMNQNNLLYSFDVLRANTSLFFDGAVSRHYYLSLAMGHHKLLQWAYEEDIEPDIAYLVAPFGPKPLVVGAWAAMQVLYYRVRRDKVMPKPIVDLVLADTHHYGSPYSLGRRGPSAYFSMPRTEVVGDADRLIVEGL